VEVGARVEEQQEAAVVAVVEEAGAGAEGMATTVARVITVKAVGREQERVVARERALGLAKEQDREREQALVVVAAANAAKNPRLPSERPTSLTSRVE